MIAGRVGSGARWHSDTVESKRAQNVKSDSDQSATDKAIVYIRLRSLVGAAALAVQFQYNRGRCQIHVAPTESPWV